MTDSLLIALNASITYQTEVQLSLIQIVVPIVAVFAVLQGFRDGRSRS